MNKLSKLANKASEVKSAPLVERKDDGKVMVGARVSKETKQKLKDLNISFQKFVNETIESYIQKEIERIRNL